MTEDDGSSIDDVRVGDVHGELVGFVRYRSSDGRCAGSGDTIRISARLQEHPLEQRGVQVKSPFDGAALCPRCRTPGRRSIRSRPPPAG